MTELDSRARVALLLCMVLVAACGEPEEIASEGVEEPAPVVVVEPVPPPPPWTEEAVLVTPGQVITKLLQDQGLDYGEALAVVDAGKAIHDLARIRAGETLTIRKGVDDGSFLALIYPLDRFGERRLHVRRADDDATGPRFVGEELARPLRIGPVPLSGSISGSFWGTCERLGLRASNIVEFAAIFEWEVDFNTQVRAGDGIRLVIEDVRDAETNEHLRYGKILAADYTSSGKEFVGVRYEDAEGGVGYFNEKGFASRKMFLKSPLKFSRVSSRFSKRRYHPILKKWRSHNGVDYAAGKGTPVRAIGRGTVRIAGTKGGYGKHVRLRHNDVYGSSYSHLSRIAVRRGQVVNQGDIVGYVGSTGLATGPHLHFEFYVHGGYRNFLAQKFPRSQPISKQERPAFEAIRDAYLPMLRSIPRPAPALAERDPKSDGEDRDGGSDLGSSD
jgi:murein DD-endopeptidase MepM/ murein hydrolase activator NlpD